MCYGNILEASMRHARKPHVCTFCGETILASDPYESMKFIDTSGDLRVQKHCLRCAALLRNVDSDDGCIVDFEAMKQSEASSLGWKRFRAMVRDSANELLSTLKPRRKARGGAS